MTASDDFWDNLFHSCALVAFVEQAKAEQGWPDATATRRRAYQYYEDALAAKNARVAPPDPSPRECQGLTSRSKRARIGP